MENKQIYVLYHGNCTDGFTAAWAAWKKFRDKAEYVPLRYGLPIPVELKDKDVFFLDFVPDEVDIIRGLVEMNRSVVGIDHHISSTDKMGLFTEHVFDLNRSGAFLAWDYFHPDKKMPSMVGYVQDEDLYRWKVPGSKEITTYISMLDYDFSVWDETASAIETPEGKNKYLEQGRLLLNFKETLVEEIIGYSYSVEFEGYKVLAVDSVLFATEIGNQLCRINPPFGIIWHEDGDMVKISLRSDGSVDVSEIARKYGGGGHRAAAGFELKDIKGIPWKKIR